MHNVEDTIVEKLLITVDVTQQQKLLRENNLWDEKLQVKRYSSDF